MATGLAESRSGATFATGRRTSRRGLRSGQERGRPLERRSGPPEPPRHRQGQASAAPALVLRAELEQPVKSGIEAETHEDEQRPLISLQPLPRALREVADDLEAMLEERAA
jgi:hypothetical protein